MTSKSLPAPISRPRTDKSPETGTVQHKTPGGVEVQFRMAKPVSGRQALSVIPFYVRNNEPTLQEFEIF